MNEIERRFLRRLSASDLRGVAKSQIPATCLSLIRALQTCGAADYHPATRGRGLVFRILDSEAFRGFVASRVPGGLKVKRDEIPDRGAAVAMLADAKAVREAVGQGVLARAAKPGIVIRKGEEAISISELSQRSGAACINIASFDRWTFSGRIAVIENADSFWEHELVLPEIDIAFLAAGRMSRRFVAWLGSDGMRECQITHWGDYDPVGVCEFLRLNEIYPDRVTTYAPEEVDQLLPRFGKPKLILDQTRALHRLRKAQPLPYISRMVGLFDSYRRGLEQEIFVHLAKSR